MRICDLSTSASTLQRVTKRLKEKWEETRTHWNDKARGDFEEKHLRPLFAQVSITGNAIQRLAASLERAERDCQDRAADGLPIRP